MHHFASISCVCFNFLPFPRIFRIFFPNELSLAFAFNQFDVATVGTRLSPLEMSFGHINVVFVLLCSPFTISRLSIDSDLSMWSSVFATMLALELKKVLGGNKKESEIKELQLIIQPRSQRLFPSKLREKP